MNEIATKLRQIWITSDVLTLSPRKISPPTSVNIGPRLTIIDMVVSFQYLNMVNYSDLTIIPCIHLPNRLRY